MVTRQAAGRQSLRRRGSGHQLAAPPKAVPPGDGTRDHQSCSGIQSDEARNLRVQVQKRSTACLGGPGGVQGAETLDRVPWSLV